MKVTTTHLVIGAAAAWWFFGRKKEDEQETAPVIPAVQVLPGNGVSTPLPIDTANKGIATGEPIPVVTTINKCSLVSGVDQSDEAGGFALAYDMMYANEYPTDDKIKDIEVRICCGDSAAMVAGLMLGL